MRKRYSLIAALLFLLLNSCFQRKQSDIVIATAASSAQVMDELKTAFEKKTKKSCDLVIGSSGSLCAQIEHRAPYDLFVAADMDYPEKLYEKGLCRNKPYIYAQGKLALWGIFRDDLELSALNEEQLRISIANYELAPYGVAAKQALEKLNIWDSLQNNLIVGESITQTNQFIQTGAVDVGFTSMSSVHNPHIAAKGSWLEVPETFYDPIYQGLVIIKREEQDLETAQQFYDFLLSEEAKLILESYGYLVN